MPAITPTVTFASLTGPIQLSTLDTNFTQLANALNAIGIVGTTGGVTVGPPASGITLVSSVNVGATSVALTNCPLDAIGNINSYVQIDVHNALNGALSSSDLVATADTGGDTSQFVDVGVNSSGFSDPTWTISGALDAYLYASDGALTIGTKSAKSVSFHTGGILAANIRGSINSTGNWSISAPTTGTSLTVGQYSTTVGINVTGTSPSIQLTDNGANGAYLNIVASNTGYNINASYVNSSPGTLNIQTAAVTRMSFNSLGAVTVTGTLGINNATPPAQKTGFGTPTGTGVIANFPGATATLAQCSQAIAQIITDLKAFGLYGA